MRIAATCVVATLLLAACSPTGQGSSESAETAVRAETESNAVTSTSIPEKTDVSSTTSSTTPEPQGPSFVGGLDLGAILLQNPTSGGGDLPELAWHPLDDVDRYSVFVFDAQGDLYWSWSTTENSVFVGGIETDNSDVPGPRILPGMTWSVLGIDSSGVLVAQSELRPVSP